MGTNCPRQRWYCVTAPAALTREQLPVFAGNCGKSFRPAHGFLIPTAAVAPGGAGAAGFVPAEGLPSVRLARPPLTHPERAGQQPAVSRAAACTEAGAGRGVTRQSRHGKPGTRFGRESFSGRSRGSVARSTRPATAGCAHSRTAGAWHTIPWHTIKVVDKSNDINAIPARLNRWRVTADGPEPPTPRPCRRPSKALQRQDVRGGRAGKGLEKQDPPAQGRTATDRSLAVWPCSQSPANLTAAFARDTSCKAPARAFSASDIPEDDLPGLNAPPRRIDTQIDSQERRQRRRRYRVYSLCAAVNLQIGFAGRRPRCVRQLARLNGVVGGQLCRW